MITNVLKKLQCLLFALLLALSLAACGGGGDDGDGGDDGGAISGQGTLTTVLTDAATDDYQAVYVTIARVEVHAGSENNEESLWQTVAEPAQTYNLLELVNGVREELGQAALAAGHYTQMRLFIGQSPDADANILGEAHPFANYVIDQDDNEIHELKVPSGVQSGLKLVKGFDILADTETELLLDFDASRSVVKAGASGQYLLKPTIKVLQTETNAVIEGTVTAAPPVTEPTADPVPLAGALVNAQTTAPAATDPRDQVVIEAGTVTEDNGEYTLFLMPGDYHLLASREGYLPACRAVSLAANNPTTIDFNLDADAAGPGTLLFTVDLIGAPMDQAATIELRQILTCENAGTPATVTVESRQVTTGEYTISLPAGSYQGVVSSSGMGTQTAMVTIDPGVATENIVFELMP